MIVSPAGQIKKEIPLPRSVAATKNTNSISSHHLNYNNHDATRQRGRSQMYFSSVYVENVAWQTLLGLLCILVPFHVVKSLQQIWRLGTRRVHWRVPIFKWVAVIGHQYNSPCNGHQGDIPYWYHEPKLHSIQYIPDRLYAHGFVLLCFVVVSWSAPEGLMKLI